MTHCKRLIEVDLPIKSISAHARREKSIRHGHISTLHIWWARRPLAACRAVICASLWLDPADELCPPAFRESVAKALCHFAGKVRSMKHLGDLCEVSGKRWRRTDEQGLNGEESCIWDMRYALLDFIADFANWDASNVPEFLEAARAITDAAHRATGGFSDTRPLIIDPFAGGGAIPLEAVRVGADIFASDLNPVAVLLNKVILEYVPKYGIRLSEEVRKWGDWLLRAAHDELSTVYHSGADEVPVAWIWARTIRCDGPNCGVEIPLIRSLALSQKKSRPRALVLIPNKGERRIDIRLVDSLDKTVGTMRSGSATCPVCGYTTPNVRVREQLSAQHGGARHARLLAVVVVRGGERGRHYRLPTTEDFDAVERAGARYAELERSTRTPSPIPNEHIPRERPSPNARGLSAVTRIGIRSFGDLFTARQALTLATFARLISSVGAQIAANRSDGIGDAVQTILALALSRLVDRTCSLSRWRPQADQEKIESVFGRQALAIAWDFAEGTPFSDGTASWGDALEAPLRVLEANVRVVAIESQALLATATDHPLANDIAQGMITDPPYYDAIPYADLSDFFYVWLRRALNGLHASTFASGLTPKDEEAIWNPSRIYSKTGKPKDETFYEGQMSRALAEARRVTCPAGIGVIVFAHKSTSGWEAILSALVEAGWIATASWPIDTEMGSRVNAVGTASLASSVHIVCRPRENPDGSLRTDDIGDWRDVLTELPKRIHEWLPRLKDEGVVGADAIFACLGPALEIFSRYSKVEDAAGNEIKLKTYLEKVWEAVAKEALSVIFSGADATGFEPDARLTAMWLWTLFSASSSSTSDGEEDDNADEEDEQDAKNAKTKMKGFSLEYDAARKIAQGLGADLETMGSLVEVKGEIARLLSVDERRKTLFGKAEDAGAEAKTKSAKKKGQLALGFKAGDDEEPSSDLTFGVGAGPVQPGQSVLDRVHQAMLLFGANQGAALKRFLVENQVGQDDRFWSLAQHLSALYPASSSEKRLVDGVLARKKGLGF